MHNKVHNKDLILFDFFLTDTITVITHSWWLILQRLRLSLWFCLHWWLGINKIIFSSHSPVILAKCLKNYKIKLVTKAPATPTPAPQVTHANGTSLSEIRFQIRICFTDTNKLHVNVPVCVCIVGIVWANVCRRNQAWYWHQSNHVHHQHWEFSGGGYQVCRGLSALAASQGESSDEVIKQALLKLLCCLLFTLVSHFVCLAYQITAIVRNKKTRSKKNFPCFVLPGQRLGQFGFLVSWILDACWICGILNLKIFFFFFVPGMNFGTALLSALPKMSSVGVTTTFDALLELLINHGDHFEQSLSLLYFSHQICSHVI